MLDALVDAGLLSRPEERRATLLWAFAPLLLHLAVRAQRPLLPPLPSGAASPVEPHAARAGSSQERLAATPSRRGPMTTLHRRFAALCFALPALAACRQPAAAEAPIPPEAVARARAVIAPLKASLRDTLQGALTKGPEAAIDACALSAPGLAAAASRDGVLVGRSALRLRNPSNAPRPWLAPLLPGLAAERPLEGAHRAVRLPDGRVGYAEAIVVQPPCLTCHGEAVAPPVLARLRERYPGDQAVGFRAGDFRGVFWAELPASAAR